MATALQERKATFGPQLLCVSAQTSPVKSSNGLETTPEARQAPAPDGHPSALLWESEFEDFLEVSEQEERLLEQMTPWANARAFLAAFEYVALACRWPRKEWVVRLLPSLNDDAEKAFLALAAQDQGDFWKVKGAILRREAAARERKRQEFRRFCYQEANGPQEVHARLRELGRQWLSLEKNSKEQLFDALILEQFLNVLPKEMQNWVKERSPESSQTAATLAENFLRRLQIIERGEEPEPEEPTVSLKSQEVHMEGLTNKTVAKREMYEMPAFPRKAVPGYKKRIVKKKGYIQWVQIGDTKLKARFPGRVKRALTYHRKKIETTLESRRSERLRRGRFLPQVKASSLPPSPLPPPSSPEGKPKPKKPALLPKPPKSQIRNCPDCGRDFSGVSSFARHRLVHTGEKRYECCFCGKGFIWRSDLVRHECIHTGKMPHECPFCGEGFDRKWKRVKHEMIHRRGKASL
ncbi:zinc finger and SCAN domain-containing protein 16-like isoform X2 [Anolis carolinensis]|uniref:zinc finger and SCAN domain-containing protein 16-like isoform X2 n=1 Tax=Anolis carolinensis TaxID=28377 RepID=UPI002F2B74D9